MVTVDGAQIWVGSGWPARATNRSLRLSATIQIWLYAYAPKCRRHAPSPSRASQPALLPSCCDYTTVRLQCACLPSTVWVLRALARQAAWHTPAWLVRNLPVNYIGVVSARPSTAVVPTVLRTAALMLPPAVAETHTRHRCQRERPASSLRCSPAPP